MRKCWLHNTLSSAAGNRFRKNTCPIKSVFEWMTVEAILAQEVLLEAFRTIRQAVVTIESWPPMPSGIAY
jgi:hypothetical protein